MSDETITFLVLGVVVAVFIRDHRRAAAVVLGSRHLGLNLFASKTEE